MYIYITVCAFKVSNSLESKWDKQDDVTQNFTFADLAILSQYFFLHVTFLKLYCDKIWRILFVHMLRLFVMRKGCVSYMKFVLVMNLFLHKGFLFSFWKDRKQSTIFEKCMITLTLVWWLYEGGYIVSIIVTFNYQIFMVLTSFGCNVIFHTFECF